jgi:5-methylthioadenosine/S-adenosylhomocysteine deaminase
MKTIIRNGLIVTKDDKNRILRNGCIEIENDVITQVCEQKKYKAADDEKTHTIDASEMIVIPGFVSMHSHLYSAIVRSVLRAGFSDDDFSFLSFMEKFWCPKLEDTVNRDELYSGSLANMLGNIRSGITTTTDSAEGSYALPGVLDAVHRAAVESGMRAVLSFETISRISKENQDLGLKENIDFIEKVNRQHGRITGRIGVHTTFTCTKELLIEARKEADRLGCGMMMHLADDRYHAIDSIRRYGKRPARFLEDIGFLKDDLILFHCSYLDPLKDPVVLKRHGVKIAHNSESNAIYGFWPNMIPYIEAGVVVGLGTDGMSHSMFEIMRTAQMIHRIRYENPELLADTQMMDMATSKGAKALMMDKEIGSLERGKKADIVMLKNQSTVPLFEDNVENYIVGTCERCHVDTVMIDGKIVLEKGDFVEVDEDKILNSCRREASGLWRRNGWALP